jgi:hypothetical protein
MAHLNYRLVMGRAAIERMAAISLAPREPAASPPDLPGTDLHDPRSIPDT